LALDRRRIELGWWRVAKLVWRAGFAAQLIDIALDRRFPIAIALRHQFPIQLAGTATPVIPPLQEIGDVRIDPLDATHGCLLTWWLAHAQIPVDRFAAHADLPRDISNIDALSPKLVDAAMPLDRERMVLHTGSFTGLGADGTAGGWGGTTDRALLQILQVDPTSPSALRQPCKNVCHTRCLQRA